MRSLLCCRLDLPAGPAQRAAGSVSLYSVRTHAFSTDDRRVRLLVAHAALVIALSRERADNVELRRALSSNRTIGTAIGILMTRHLVTADQAFHLLRRTSQNRNRKVRDVAAAVAATGTIPPPDTHGEPPPRRGAPPASGRSHASVDH